MTSSANRYQITHSLSKSSFQIAYYPPSPNSFQYLSPTSQSQNQPSTTPSPNQNHPTISFLKNYNSIILPYPPTIILSFKSIKSTISNKKKYQLLDNPCSFISARTSYYHSESKQYMSSMYFLTEEDNKSLLFTTWEYARFREEEEEEGWTLPIASIKWEWWDVIYRKRSWQEWCSENHECLKQVTIEGRSLTFLANILSTKPFN